MTFVDLDIAASPPRVCGVYVLILKHEAVYVGSSRDVLLRIEQHREGHDKRIGPRQFDRALLLEVESDRLEHVEGVLIRALRPPLTRKGPRYRGDDNAVLMSLGLQPHDDERANASEWRALVYQPWSAKLRRRHGEALRQHAARRKASTRSTPPVSP